MKSRYIPANAEEVRRLDLPGVVYAYANANGEPCAIAYKERATKHTWRYIFMNNEQRQCRIDQFFDAIAQNEDRKIARRSERASFKHGYKTGDILYSSWGYDQTNIEFYQITAATEKTVTFREIGQIRGSRNLDSWTTSPNKNNFISDAKFTRTVTAPHNPKEKGDVSFAEYEGGMMRHLYEWDGKEKYASDGH